MKVQVIASRQESLRNFVTEDEYAKIKKACSELIAVMKTVTLRKIWAVVDHLVNVSDGREPEIKYAANSEKTNGTSPASKPGTKPGGTVPKRPLR